MLNLEQILSAEDLEILSGLAVIYGVAFLFSLAISVVCYVFNGLGLYKMGKNLGISSPWMAWVPVVSSLLFGKIASKYIKKDNKPSAKFGGWLMGLNITNIVLYIGSIVSFVFVFGNALILAESAQGNPESFPTELLASLMSFLMLILLLFACAVAYTVIYYIALWRIYAIFDNSTATVFLVLSILFSVATPFLLFALRNNRPSFTYFDRIGYIPPQNSSTNE